MSVQPIYAFVCMYVCTYPEPVGDGLWIIRAVAISVVVGDDSGAAAEEELGRGRGAGEEGLRGEADGEGELEVVPLPDAADPRVPLPPSGGFGGGQQLRGGARRRGGGGGGGGGRVGGGGEGAPGAPLGRRRGHGGRVDDGDGGGGGLVEQRVVREERQPRLVRAEVAERGGGGRWRGQRRVKSSAAVRHGGRRPYAWSDTAVVARLVVACVARSGDWRGRRRDVSWCWELGV